MRIFTYARFTYLFITFHDHVTMNYSIFGQLYLPSGRFICGNEMNITRI